MKIEQNFIIKRLKRYFPSRIKKAVKRIIRYNYNTPWLWDEIWQREEFSTYRQYINRNNYIIDQLNRDLKVLDVGCGVGVLLNRIISEKRCNGIGIDISFKAISIMNLLGIKGVVARAEYLPFLDSYFDIVIATEIIEHLPHPSKCIIEVKRILKTKGLFIASVPDNRLGPEVEEQHYRKYNKESLEDFLSNYFPKIINTVRITDICNERGEYAPFLITICQK